MDEKRVREIALEVVKQVFQTNYDAGSPKVAPHYHDGNDGLKVSLGNLNGVTQLGQMEGTFPVQYDYTYTTPAGAPEPGFLASLTPAGSETGTLRPAQYLTNPEVAVLTKVPVIQGNGPSVQGAFNGGNAPNGTVLFFANGSTLSNLWIRLNGEWYGINVDSVI